MTKLVANWSYPTAIRFGAGRIAELPRPAGCRHCTPLLVTDAGLAKLDITRKASPLDRAAGGGPVLRRQAQPGGGQPHRRRRRLPCRRP